MPKIAFVPADGLGRTRAEHRRLIRSHCMRGKNKKKYRNTRDVGDHTDVITQQLPVDISVSRATSAAEIHSHTVSARPAVWSSAATGYTLPSPERPPSVFSLLTFAREIDDLSRELLFKYFFVAREIFYPIQFCVYSDASLFIWFEWLFYDVAYLEAVLLGMSAMDDFYRRAPPSKLTYSSLKATIHALNKRLSDPDLCLADSTIAVVMGLAELAGILSDDAAVKAHVSGFQKMVRLRGGISAFAHNKKLQIKIGRFDLIHSLGTGNPPQFFMDPISWCPIFGLLHRPNIVVSHLWTSIVNQHPLKFQC
ncbi:uncharacterized protein THITE_2085255 [Thermothielavioides terrestris NRRL 8126]|uniref:Transcription factor domain-containing protein n=1 Tax=Thermothielavioides terrestris (strain ATCC 38088 / NRRL 8126) TaxID=578455 RepID=G2QUU6_THETT|nr:uncharacterized protein THITE_2085255 [Thermothielavioides terrestris NRRL 8126]AEO63741.1 hypothetical protein THITE_2085255 [Thermothielavioides terrestris NRRL 8126]